MQPYFAAWQSLIPIHRPIDLSLLDLRADRKARHEEEVQPARRRTRRNSHCRRRSRSSEADRRAAASRKGAKAAVAEQWAAPPASRAQPWRRRRPPSRATRDGGVAGPPTLEVAEPVAEYEAHRVFLTPPEDLRPADRRVDRRRRLRPGLSINLHVELFGMRGRAAPCTLCVAGTFHQGPSSSRLPAEEKTSSTVTISKMPSSRRRFVAAPRLRPPAYDCRFNTIALSQLFGSFISSPGIFALCRGPSSHQLIEEAAPRSRSTPPVAFMPSHAYSSWFLARRPTGKEGFFPAFRMSTRERAGGASSPMLK